MRNDFTPTVRRWPTEDSASTKYCECSSHDISFLPGNSHLIEQMNAQLDELINEIEMTQRLLNFCDFQSIIRSMKRLIKICSCRLRNQNRCWRRRMLSSDDCKPKKQQFEQSLALELAKPRQRVSRCLQFASQFRERVDQRRFVEACICRMKAQTLCW